MWEIPEPVAWRGIQALARGTSPRLPCDSQVLLKPPRTARGLWILKSIQRWSVISITNGWCLISHNSWWVGEKSRRGWLWSNNVPALRHHATCTGLRAYARPAASTMPESGALGWGGGCRVCKAWEAWLRSQTGWLYSCLQQYELKS